MSAATRGSAYAARNPTAAPKEKPAKITGSVNPAPASRERRAHRRLPQLPSVLAFAQSGAAEVEPQHGESEAVERFHGVEDYFVVQRSAIQRMRMANDRGMRRVGRPGVEQRFQASGGTGKKERANGGGFGEHVIRVQLSAGRWSGALAGIQIFEHLLDRNEQSRHTRLHRLPQQTIINRVVTVTHTIPHPCDAAPVHRWIPTRKFRGNRLTASPRTSMIRSNAARFSQSSNISANVFCAQSS